MSNEKCKFCNLSRVVDLSGVVEIGMKKTYECHANPPAVVMVITQNALGQPVQGIQAVFPPVPENEWCGKFEMSIEK